MIKEIIKRIDRVSLLQNNLSHTALLAKFLILLSILIHSLCLLPGYELFYNCDWLERVTIGLKEQPALFLVLSSNHSSNLTLFFAVAEIVALVFALIEIRSVFSLLPVIFFSMNIYNATWAVQDGGNNLAHIYLYYLLLATIPPVGNENNSPTFQISAVANNCSVFLLRAQLLIMYFCAAISKIQGELWQNGMSLFYIYQSDYFGTPVVRNLIFQYPEISAFGAYLAIFFQLAFCFLVLDRKYRIPLLVIGTGFHLGIAVSMKLHTFALTMILSYAAFLPDEIAKKIIDTFLPKRVIAIAFNGCCRSWIKFRNFIKLYLPTRRGRFDSEELA